jgi:hypothetical protein
VSRHTQEQATVGGYIAHFNLIDWWLATFSSDERARLAKVFTQSYAHATDRGPDWSLDHGVVVSTGMSELRFLSRLAAFSRAIGDRSVTDRVLARAADAKGSFVDRHIYLGILIQHTPKSETAYIELLCRELIELAPAARMWFRTVARKRPLPGHIGFQQLAILKEKQKAYGEAVELCRQALRQGWRGDWEKRIERCELRRSKLAERELGKPRDTLIRIAPKRLLALPCSTAGHEPDRLIDQAPAAPRPARLEPPRPWPVNTLNDDAASTE